ncbi:MAG: sulfite exporter TauE/SafE family protein [Tabrizicola sp.]|nr:sulfite exporter TauE/SafE family protein [Tabrizicola sp.]
MDVATAGDALPAFIAALAITAFAGFVKGTVGFAMPMIMMSALSSFLPPEEALAALILPTLVTNLSQSLRQGVHAAVDTARTYRRFLIAVVVFIALSAPFVTLLPRTVFLLLLGGPITIYALIQLAGKTLVIRVDHRRRAEWGLGVIGGIYGGISGIWGPPLLVYLLSIGVGKVEIIRAQGVVFLVGSVALLLAHLGTGIADAEALAFSAILACPALIGLYLGYVVQDRLDQQRFRRWTQGLLVLTGLNLIRQALGL